MARDNGRHGSCQGPTWNDSQGTGHQHPIQLHARIRRAADGRVRNQLLFRGKRIELKDLVASTAARFLLTYAGRSVLNMSNRTFHEPSACFFQMVRYFPLSLMDFPAASV